MVDHGCACPAGNPVAEDAITFPKPCSPPGAPVRGVRAGGARAPSGCPSLSVPGGWIEVKPPSGSRGAVSKVRGDRRSVNLRPGGEPGKAGPRGCRHAERGRQTCPPHSLHPSIYPSLPPCSACWGLVVGFDRWMSGWVGFSPCLGARGQPSYQGHGEQKQPIPCPGWAGCSGGWNHGVPGSGLLWVLEYSNFC